MRRRNTKETFRYRWIEAVPIRDGNDALWVNWIGFESLDAKGKVKYSMAWVTSLSCQHEDMGEETCALGGGLGPGLPWRRHRVARDARRRR